MFKVQLMIKNKKMQKCNYFLIAINSQSPANEFLLHIVGEIDKF